LGNQISFAEYVLIPRECNQAKFSGTGLMWFGPGTPMPGSQG